MQKTTTRLGWLFIGLFCFINMDLAAQTITENDRGETIVRFSDGSWRYYDENDAEDQELMHQYLRTLNNPSAIRETAPNTNVSPDPTETTFEEQARQKAIRRAESALAREAQTVTHELDATRKREAIEKRIATLRNQGSSDETIQFLKGKLKEVKKAERAAEDRREKASKEARLYERMIYMSGKKRDKLLAEIAEEKNRPTNFSTISDVEALHSAAQSSSGKASVSRTNLRPSKPRSAFKILSASEDVMLNPPSPDCQIAFDGIDKFSNKRRRDVAPTSFFNHTTDRLRSYYKDKDRLECAGHMSAIAGGYKFLSITVIINDEKAQRTYGSIEKGSMLSIKLLDGTNVQLTNNKTDPGVVDQLNKRVIYHAQYMIGPDQEKAFKKLEIDRVRLVWSTGYEDYEVYETDFMMNQFMCLNKRN